MEGQDNQLGPVEAEQEEQQQEVFNTVLEVIECTDHDEYRKVIKGLEKKGYKLMYNVENNLVGQHLDHFKQTRRFRAVALVTVFIDHDSVFEKSTIDKANTAIWYLS
jgi:hypothetical protein